MEYRRRSSKSDLIAEIHNRLDNVTRKEIENVLEAYSEVASEHLWDNVAVPTPSIGKLTITYRESRPARNPRTGEQVMTQPSTVPKFKPTNPLEDSLNS